MTIVADKCVSALTVIDYCDCYFGCRCASTHLTASQSFSLPVFAKSSVTVQWQLNRAFTSSTRQVVLFSTAVLASIEASSRRIDCTLHTAPRSD